jgi:hypothetical protein
MERMKKSYWEGIAIHSGPEPCEDSRKAVLEALDRGICRLGIELRNQTVQGAAGDDDTEFSNGVWPTEDNSALCRLYRGSRARFVPVPIVPHSEE